ncbi:MAG TPA: hypothetical protein VN682_04570 [Terriglobales bacterium]|nr:hypothetical protein [Terriglobales bacterium]
MRTLSKVMAIMILVGWLAPESQVAAQSAPEAGATYPNQLQNIEDNDRCLSYGAQPGTKPYADCRMQLNQMHLMARQAVENQSNTQVEDRNAALVQQFLANQARQQQDSYDQQMANIRAWGQSSRLGTSPHSLNCTTSYVGNYAYTNCQ